MGATNFLTECFSFWSQTRAICCDYLKMKGREDRYDFTGHGKKKKQANRKTQKNSDTTAWIESGC